MNIGKNFNPSKKVDFQLYVNDTLIQSGYMKLIDIEYITEYNWRYNISLFGELGNFINLIDNKKLKDILTSYKNNYIQYSSTFPRVDKTDQLYTLDYLYRSKIDSDRSDYNLNDLYNNDYSIDKFFSYGGGYNCPTIYLDLIDAENGLYSDGLKIKSASGELELPYPHTEQELCLKNELKQRLGFYIDKLIVDIIRGMGYELVDYGEEGDWVSKNNPYWFKLITNAIIPDKIEDNWNYNASGSSFVKTTITSGTIKNYSIGSVISSSYNPDGADISIGTNVQRKYGPNDNNYNVTMTPVVLKDIYPNRCNSIYSLSIPDNNYIFNSGLVSRETNKSGIYMPISTTGIQLYFRIRQIIIDGENGVTNQKSYINKEVVLTNDNFVDEKSNFYKFRIVIPSLSYYGRLEVYKGGEWITIDDLMKNATFEFIKNPYYDNGQNLSVVYHVEKSTSTSYQLTNGTSSISIGGFDFLFNNNATFEYKLSSNSDVGVSSKVKYWDILPNLEVKEFLLSYLKMFGLYLDINNDKKTISIKSRNNFYKDNEIKYWDDKICIDRDIKITPLSFDKKYIRLSYNDSGSNLTELYKNKYGINYGQMLLNTGYEFNNDTYDLFENIVFSDYINVSQNEDIYGSNSNPKIIPHLYKDDIRKSKRLDKHFLFFASNPYITKSVGKIPSTRTTGSYSIPSTTLINFGFFNNGYKNLYYSRIKMDDYNLFAQEIKVDDFGKINLSHYTHQWNYGPVGKESNLDHMYNPTTQYYPYPTDIQYSLDFGKPFIIYHNNDYPSGTTIYDRLWKKYLEDRYNINTKIMVAYFYLTEKDLNNFKFNDFIFLKNKYWVVNKIIDYDVINNEPVKVELISVNDLDNYINGQNY